MSEEITAEERQKLDEISNAVALRKSQHETNIMEIVKKEEDSLVNSDQFAEISKKVSEERIKADLSAEASRIRSKNLETAENELQNETRELRLAHLKEELKLAHKYNMETLKKDEKHRQMLSKRKKMVEKYGYLYDFKQENCMTAYDDKGQPFSVPNDFSYSTIVNKIRQFGRNISKLDRPILQTIKWFLIIGVGVGIYFILKSIGIIK